MEGIYGRKRYMRKGGRSGVCKRIGRQVQRKKGCRSKETRESKLKTKKKRQKSVEGWSYQESIQQSCCMDGTIENLRQNI